MKKLAVIIFLIFSGLGIEAQTTDVILSGSGNQCRLSWKVTGQIPGSFTIERRTNSGAWTVIESSYVMPAPFPGYKFNGINRNFYYVDTGLSSGSTYEYRVDGTLSNLITLRGTTYYVKNGGNDNSSGLSDATAWATIERANRDRNPGDLVLFRRGDTFTSSGEVDLQGTGDGTAENPIKWSSYGTGNYPVLRMNHKWGLQVRDIRYRHFEFLKFVGNLTNGHESVFYIGCYNRDVYGIKVLSCEFDLSNVVLGPMAGIFIWNDDGNHNQRNHNSDIEIAYSEIYGSQARSGIRSHDVQHHAHYHNNYIHDNGSQITCSGGANHTVEYNELRGGTYSNPANSGTKANSQAYNLKNMTYRRNIVYYCENYGISLQDSEGGLVEYNTVYDRGGTYGSFYAFSPDTLVNWTGNRVRGNIFVGSNSNNGAARIDVGDLGGDWRSMIDWDNNCLYETAGAIVKFNNPSSSINSHSEWTSMWRPYHPNDIHADPQFIDAVNGDFRLKAGSPAEGKGYSAKMQ